MIPNLETPAIRKPGLPAGRQDPKAFCSLFHRLCSMLLVGALTLSSVDMSSFHRSRQPPAPASQTIFLKQALSLDANDADHPLLVRFHWWPLSFFGRNGKKTSTHNSADWVPYASIRKDALFHEFESRHSSAQDRKALEVLSHWKLIPSTFSESFDRAVQIVALSPEQFSSAFAAIETEKTREVLRDTFKMFPEWTAHSLTALGSDAALLRPWINSDLQMNWDAVLDHYPPLFLLELNSVQDVWSAQRWVQMLNLPHDRYRIVYNGSVPSALVTEQFPDVRVEPGSSDSDATGQERLVRFGPESTIFKSDFSGVHVPYDGIRFAPLEPTVDADDRARFLERLGLQDSLKSIGVLYGLTPQQTQQLKDFFGFDPSDFFEWVTIPFPSDVHEHSSQRASQEVVYALAVADVALMGDWADRILALSQGSALIQWVGGSENSDLEFLRSFSAVKEQSPDDIPALLSQWNSDSSKRRILLMGSRKARDHLQQEESSAAALFCAQLSAASVFLKGPVDGRRRTPNDRRKIIRSRPSWIAMAWHYAQAGLFIALFFAIVGMDYVLFGDVSPSSPFAYWTSIILLEIGTALSAGLFAQWMERHHTFSEGDDARYEAKPVLRLLAFSLNYAAPVEGLIYGIGLPHLSGFGFIPDDLAQILADIFVVSPFFTNPNAFYYYGSHVHPKSKVEARREVREKLLGFDLTYEIVWIVFLALAMHYRDRPVISFGLISAGTWCWTVAFEMGKFWDSEVLLQKLEAIPALWLLTKPLRALQTLYSHRHLWRYNEVSTMLMYTLGWAAYFAMIRLPFLSTVFVGAALVNTIYSTWLIRHVGIKRASRQWSRWRESRLSETKEFVVRKLFRVA